jgi:hypothetical protein
MSDHTPTNERELDDRIRGVVARVVADAPPVPELTTVAAPIDPRPSRDRRPWWIVGTSVVAAAAATVALVIVTQRGDDAIAPVDAPLAVVPDESDVPDPSGVPDVTSTPMPSSEPVDVAATDPGPPAPPADVTTPLLAVADGSSVVLADAAGNGTGRIEQSWSIALAVGDGRVVGQERSGAGYGRWEAEATTPRIWSPDGTVLELFPVVADRSIALHDIAIVDGRPWLLYSVHNGVHTPDDEREELHAVSLDGLGEVLDIGQIGAWEGGTHRLHLAANGLIVGESFGEGTSSILVLSLPGSPASAWAGDLSPEALGLDSMGYFDCAATCPTAYSVDDAGTAIAWIEADELVVVPVPGGVPDAEVRRPIVGDPTLAIDLDLIDVAAPSFVMSYFLADGDLAEPAQMVVSDSNTILLPGLAATWGPAGAGTSAPITPITPTSEAASPVTVAPSVAPPPATQPPAIPASPETAAPTTVATAELEQFLVTAAGDSGVVQFTPAVPRSAAVVGEPTEIAFETTLGLLFQRQRGYVEGRDPAATIPQLRDPSGATSAWVVAASAEPGSWWSLHDVVEYQDEPWVIYSLQRRNDEPLYENPSGDVYEYIDRLYAVPLAGGTPVDLGQIGAWESGSSRVQASPDGVLVASFSESVTTSYWTATLPGATAAAPSPEALGIAAHTSECETCP